MWLRKMFPPGTVVAGNPAKVIGNFYDLLKKRQVSDVDDVSMNAQDFLNADWERFYENRKQ